MKIALVQGRVVRDRPADNLESIKAALKRPELQKMDLIVFPGLILSGRLGPNTLSRPALASQYNQAFNDLLAISAQHPGLTLASSALTFGPDGQAREEPFALQSGRIIGQLEPGPGAPLLSFPLAVGLVVLQPGRATTPPTGADGADAWITLGSQLFEGQPYYPPTLGPAGSWRMNASLVGGDGPYIYDGATWVIDPAGHLKGWAEGLAPAVITLDTGAMALPSLEPPKRDPLAVLHQALVAGLRDFIRSTGSGRVLVGLSGGLDSSLVALLAVDALGPDSVLGVLMPSEYNSPESMALARQLAENLKITLLTIPIDPIREAFTRPFQLTPAPDEKNAQLADENIQARIRGVILMYLANREDRLLLATGNKSEAAMGYSTLYGDTCGAIAPLGDIYKTRLYELARHLNQAGERLPEEVITRAPSAELRPGQKDEDTLPPYPVLDDILHRHLEGGASGSQVAKEGEHSALTVAWALSALKRNSFKRAQQPFSLIASPRPLIGSDWARCDP